MAAGTTSSSQSGLDAAYLRSLFQGAGFAILACDAGGMVVAGNAAAVRLFDRERVGTAGIALSQLFPPSHRSAVESLRKNCQETLESIEYQLEFEKGGQKLVYAVWFTPVVDQDGSVRGVSLWFRDITKRTKLQRTVEKQQRLASLGALAGAVAHHYNNMLCSIATSVEYAQNMNTMSAMRRALGRSAEPLARAAQISQQLLAFAQADHRSHDLCDLTEGLLYFVDENEQRLRSQHIDLQLEWSPIPMRAVPREHLHIVLKNVTDNAVDAMPAGGTLAARLFQRDDGTVVLRIRDTGKGLPPEAMDHLFEPFFTTKGELSAGGPGCGRNAGLGLAVVHGLVGEMNGTITASNAEDGGAVFEIVLPPSEE